MNEQQIRLVIVQDLMRLHQVVDTDVIIKQATALSNFVVNGAYQATQCPKNRPCVLLLLDTDDKG